MSPGRPELPPLHGYPRPGGRWGVRNHVLVLPTRSAANRAAEGIAEGAPGAVAVSHEWVGSAGAAERELVERTLAGFAANPNVAAVVLVGVEEGDLEIAAAIADRGQTVDGLTLAAHRGTARAIEAGRGIAAARVEEANLARRRPMPLSALAIGLECGGSDALSGITANPALGMASDRLVDAGATTVLAETPELVGAEYLLAERAISADVGRQVVEMIHGFERSVEGMGVDIRGAQPTPGNIEGGLTTIEEKSLGAAKKGGSASVTGVLAYAEGPAQRGLQIMDTPGHDIEQMVGMVAGGCQIVAFTTGRGTPTGSAIAPCLKIATNTAIYERLEGDIDLDAGKILAGAETLTSMGELIYERLLAVTAGERTASEHRGNREFAIHRIHSAQRDALVT